jgi:hypothetical protein
MTSGYYPDVSGHHPTSLGPETVRSLRGPLSRAAFALRVGVTPHTIYRWELPAGSKESRRPRGAELERLSGLVRGGPLDEAPKAPAVEPLADVLAALDQVLRADWNVGRAALLRVLTSGRASSPDALALAAAGLALIEIVMRSDPRTAFATLSPALRDAEEERLAPHVAAWVHACAACAHALPDASFFDVGRVHAHAARAEALARGQIPEVAFIAWLSTMLVAIMIADEELLQRSFAAFDAAAFTDLPPFLALHELEARVLRATFAGQRPLAAKLTDEVIAGAAARGYDQSVLKK